MYITCPSCSTSYEVDGAQIGPQGRTVRCFNCHHTWHQYPVAAQAPSSMRPARAAPQPTPQYAPQSYEAPVYAEPAYAAAGGYGAHAYAAPYVPQPAPAPEPMPRRPAPVKAAKQPAQKPAPAPKPAPKPVPVEELPSEDELDSMLGPNRGDAASQAFGGGGRDEATEIDEDAVAKIPDPEPVRPVADVDDDFDLDDDIEPDEIPDPDPIPEVYGGADDDEDEEEGRGVGLKRLIAPAVSIVAVGAIVAGLIVAREPIVGLWPGANDYVYDLVGLHVMVPGDGLERKLTRTAVETVANVDHVIATGLVTNISDKEQPLPSVLVQLLDAKVQVLDTKAIKLDKPILQPGESLQFKAVFEGAPATARTVRTEWGQFVEAAPE